MCTQHPSCHRRFISKFTSNDRGKVFAALLFSLLAGQAAWAISPAQIQGLVEEQTYLAVAARYPDASFSVRALPLAASLNDKSCDDLQVQVPANRLYGRVSVHVRCAAPQTWALYAQAQVDIEMPVVVARQVIARGSRLTESMLQLEMRPLQDIRSQALTTLGAARGKAARSSIRAGQVVTINHLTVPHAVRKGERVTIQSGGGRVRIQTHGIALQSGTIGEQIEVRNTASNRVIHPWIIGPGRVSTRPGAAAGAISG